MNSGNSIAATGKGGALLAHTVRPNYHRILVRLLSFDPLQQAMRISKFPGNSLCLIRGHGVRWHCCCIIHTRIMSVNESQGCN